MQDKLLSNLGGQKCGSDAITMLFQLAGVICADTLQEFLSVFAAGIN